MANDQDSNQDDEPFAENDTGSLAIANEDGKKGYDSNTIHKKGCLHFDEKDLFKLTPNAPKQSVQVSPSKKSWLDN